MDALRGAAAACLLGLTLAAPAAAQFPLLQQPGQPRITDPQELEEPRRAPFTITPSIAITGEYNDNIFLDNRIRESDFIIGFTPGIAIAVERPTYRLATGYNFTAEIFTTETQESHAFDRQNFWLDGEWRVDPNLTLSLTDTLLVSTDTNLISTETVSTGRDRALSNTLSAGAAWRLAPLWTVRGGGSWTVERYQSDDLLSSDVYRVGASLERRLTPRIAGDIGYEFAYFDIEDEPTSTTHTPRIGVSWQATPTLSLLLRAGPSVEIKEDDTRVTPAVTAAYRHRVPFGRVGLSYDKYIGTAGGLGGTTDNQVLSGFVEVTTLLRGLTVRLLPRYTIVESPDSDRIDVRAFTAAVQATYRLTDWLSLIAGYQFYRQRSDSTAVTRIGTPIATDADQNRVMFGIQVAYPIRFD
jgi:hypothetical protein